MQRKPRKLTPVLDALGKAAFEREGDESRCELEERAFWRLRKEVGAPHHKTQLLLSFENGASVRRVLVTMAPCDEGSNRVVN